MVNCILFCTYFLLFFETEGQVSHKRHEIDMIKDIVNWFNQPSSITAYLCNKLDDSVYFVKRLSEDGIAVSIQKPNVNTLTYPFPPSYAVFVLDISCENSYGLIEKANQLSLFSSPYRWIIIDAKNCFNFSISDSIGLKILVDSEVIITNKDPKNDDNYIVSKIFKRNTDVPLARYKIGTWKASKGFVSDKLIEITAKRRKNLMKTVLKSCIVITHNDSLNHLTDKRDRHIDTISKVNYVLVQHLGDIVNASLNYSIQNTWGYKNNRSEWSGMIGELQRNEADIGGTALFLTADRVRVIDYIAMTTPTRSKFVFRQPKLSYVTNVYALPFHWSVWVSSFTLIIITAMALYGVTKWNWSNEFLADASTETRESILRSSWLEVTMVAFGAMCQQGTHSIPYSISGRIITILLFVSLMFLYTSYSANIVALLQSSSNSIQSLKDLLNSRLDVGVDDTVFNHFYFPNASEPVRRAIYLQKVAPPGQPPRFYPIQEGVRRIRKGYFAFHMETGVGYKIVGETFEEHEKCGLQEIQFLQVPDPWLAIQKNSSYKEMLKIGLRQIQESGLQSREVSLLYTKKPTCASRGSSFVSVGLIDCYLTVSVLIGGVIISFTIFLFEVVVNYRCCLFKNRNPSGATKLLQVSE